jgi:hypothetical protein
VIGLCVAEVIMCWKRPCFRDCISAGEIGAIPII